MVSNYVSSKQKVLTPKEAMELAIQEGKRGAGFVEPNPLVGCVIVNEDHVLLSTGYHKKFGGDHAETEALKGLSDEQLQGAHLYVTLEPCAHEGKTPSCAHRLSKLPLASITYGLQDPNPLVNGKGAEILRQSGKDVREFDELKMDLEELAEIFLHNVRFSKPFVAMKVACSLDGQIALRTGESRWITNEMSRFHSHRLRGTYSAILVGRRTVLIDNPNLNVRHPEFQGKSNRVLILDPRGEVLEGLRSRKVYTHHAPEDILVVVDQNSPRFNLTTAGDVGNLKNLDDSGVEILRWSLDEGRGFELDGLLKELYRRNVFSVLIEGGSFSYQSFLIQKQVQRLYHFQAPVIIGAGNGLSWTQSLSISSMAERMELKNLKINFFDRDVLMTGLLTK